MSSDEDVVHDPPVHIGQTEIAAVVSVREALVVEAELVKDRRVEVMDADRIPSSARN